MSITLEKFEAVASGLEGQPLAFITDLFDAYVHTKMDRDYYEAIIEGDYPGSNSIIARRRGCTDELIAPQLGIGE